MKTRIVTIMITLSVLIFAGSQAAFAYPAGPQSSLAYSATVSAMLDDKLVYHTEETDYEPGDCVLSATRIMIRRAGIMNDDSDWAELTNAVLRPVATEEGLMHNSFSYTDDGITYSVSTGTFTGEDSAARIGEFTELLKKHPEGIVVYGIDAADSGTHGVLVVDVKDGEVYASDSSYNMGDVNMGVQKWSDTSMLDPSLCTDYWYISEISGSYKVPAADPIAQRHFGPYFSELTYL